MPLAAGSLLSGVVMTFARALGEFGATLMFAGNFQGKTQTMPLAIYGELQSDMVVSIALAIVLVVFSFGIILLVIIPREAGGALCLRADFPCSCATSSST